MATEEAVGSERKRGALALFAGLGRRYDLLSALLSFGQDPRWRRAMVAAVDARPDERVLDVATGTGLVARELVRRYGCSVVGLDQSAEMLAGARRSARARAPSSRQRIELVQGEAERLAVRATASSTTSPSPTCCATWTIPAATLAELARVVRPGGRIASLEFGLPDPPLWRPLWRLYTRVGLPALGRLFGRDWYEVGRFLGPSIEELYERLAARAPARALGRTPGSRGVRQRRMSLGGGVVTWGVRDELRSAGRPAFYALRPGGWRDLVTLLHPPYTAWHLSYVALGAAAAPELHPVRLWAALGAFFLAVGVAAHALDELKGHPLRHPALGPHAGGAGRGRARRRGGDRHRRAVRRLRQPRALRRRRRLARRSPTTSSCSAGASTPTSGSPPPGAPSRR